MGQGACIWPVEILRPERHGKDHDIHGKEGRQPEPNQNPVGRSLLSLGAGDGRRETAAKATVLRRLAALQPQSSRHRQPAVVARLQRLRNLGHGGDSSSFWMAGKTYVKV